jgi:hypothetical protein
MGRQVIEFGDYGIRELIVPPYRIRDRIYGQNVQILGVIHSRRS